MGDLNVLPKVGALRGVTAGITLIFFVFVALSNIFPLSQISNLAPTPVTIAIVSPAAPMLDATESTPAISLPSDAPSPIQLSASTVQFSAETPDVTIGAAITAPVSTITTLGSQPTTSGIQLESSDSSFPTLGAPKAPIIATVVEESTPEVLVFASIPEVVVVEAVAIETAPVAEETPTSGIVLTGQTIIHASAPAEPTISVEMANANAFETFRANFDDSSDQVLVSFIILAQSMTEVEMLAKLPAPVTLAVAAENPDAATLIAAYRATGGEVVLVLPGVGPTSIGSGTSAADVTANLDASLAGSAGVIAVLDGPEGTINDDPKVRSAILETISRTGHALITLDGLGLNRASIMAQEAGVPATGIVVSLDGTMGTIAVVRVLDKMVLQVGDRSTITVFGPASTDILFALRFWLDSKRAEITTIAPVSASILRN